MTEEVEKIEVSIHDLETFVENRVWKVLISAAIKATDEQVDIMIGTSAFKDPDVISKAQGFIAGLSFLIDYPAVLKTEIEFERTKEERKNERR